MERFNLGYSAKNIPLPSEQMYRCKLIGMIEILIKKMRWKAIFFSEHNKNQQQTTEKAPYGLKSFNWPRTVKELSRFEEDLWKLVNIIKFHRFNCKFQKKLKDVIKIKLATTTFTQADKTSNMYKMHEDEYKRLLHNSVASNYKKTYKEVTKEINTDSKRIAKEKGVLDRMEINGTSSCFITLKDHKDNFQNNPTTRLINPAKNVIGRICKTILEKINKNVCHTLMLNQWKNSGSYRMVQQHPRQTTI